MDYDLFVIGGGSGGVRAARLTAQSGKKVAIAEGSRMGGTCVIRGCVPKKIMLFASNFPEALSDAAAYGWDLVDKKTFDWPSFKGKLHAELDRLEGIYTTNLNKAGVEIFSQYAKIVDKNTVEFADGTRKTAETILIATGARPSVPNVEGREHVLVSDDIFHLENLPKSVAIIGGGYIASEFAGILRGLGADVHQVCRSKVLREFDREVVAATEAGMRARGIKISHDTQVEKIEKTGDRRRVTFNTGESIEVDCVIYATGRGANTAGLGLEAVGVETHENGMIKVDEYSRTNIDTIYAIGDVTGRAALTPVAIREAVAFHSTLYKDTPKTVDYSLIPTAIFTTPEIGTVGLSEEAAQKQGLDYDVYASSFRPMNAIIAGREDKILLKMMVEKDSDKVIGVHIAGPGAGELIQLVGTAVTMGATKADFDATIAVHPTTAEELVTMSTPR